MQKAVRGLRTTASFPQEAREPVGSIVLNCFSKNYLCGFRVCFHSGWDGEGRDLSATLLSPKVYVTGGKLGFCIFPLSLGYSLNSCESAFSWALPSQTLGALALLDKEQLSGLGAMTVPFPAGMQGYCSLGPRLLLSQHSYNRDWQICVCLTGLLSTSLQVNCKLTTGPVSWLCTQGQSPQGGPPKLLTGTRMGRGSLCEPQKTLCGRLPGGQHQQATYGYASLGQPPLYCTWSSHLSNSSNNMRPPGLRED